MFRGGLQNKKNENNNNDDGVTTHLPSQRLMNSHLWPPEFSPNWDDTSAKVHTQTPYLWSHFPPKKKWETLHTQKQKQNSTHTKGVTWISSTAISFHIRCIWDFQQYLSDRLKGKPMRVADWKKKNVLSCFFFTKYLLLKSYISKEPKMKKNMQMRLRSGL